MKKKYIVGIDLGGTKTITGLMNDRGKIIGEIVSVPTRAREKKELILKRLIQSIKRAVRYAQLSIDSIAGIGIGSPGPLRMEEGIILTPVNLPTLHHFNIKETVSSVFELPVLLNNDANCFTLGEAWFGAGTDIDIVFGITLGTGFGSGIVINKRIYVGATETAAEIDCSPYLNGTFEDYISGRGISRIYREKSGEEITAVAIAERARRNDKKAIDTWQEFGMHLGIALCYAVNILDPGIIIIGGSISNAYDLFSSKMRETLMGHINPVPRERIKIVKGRLGDKAGFIGAGCLLLENS